MKQITTITENIITTTFLRSFKNFLGKGTPRKRLIYFLWKFTPDKTRAFFLDFNACSLFARFQLGQFII